MIKCNTSEAIKPLLTIALDHGLCVSPLPGTPLETLFKRSYNHKADMKVIKGDADLVNTDPCSSTIEASQYKDADGVVNHTVVMDEIVKTAAQAVSVQLNMARNIINPIIKDVFDKVNEVAQNATTAVGKTHEVIVRYPDPIFDESALHSLTERYSNTAFENPPDGHSIYPEMTPEDIVKYVDTGINALDTHLKRIMSDFPMAAYIVYEHYFRSTQRDDFGQIPLDIAMVLAYAIARKMQTVTPDNVTVSLDTFRSDAAMRMAQAGRYLWYIETDRQRRIKQKVLILSMPASDDLSQQIIVNGDIYKDFLNAGGTPEHLIGACLLGISNPEYADLLKPEKDSQAKVITAYNNHQRLVDHQLLADNESNISYAIVQTITRTINDFDDDDLDDYGINKTQSHQALVNYIQHRPYRHYTALYLYVQEIVCGVIFNHTPALKILQSIDGIIKDNPDMDIREAATLATIDAVACWLCSQMEVE